MDTKTYAQRRKKDKGKGKKHIISIEHITRLGILSQLSYAHVKGVFWRKRTPLVFRYSQIDLGVVQYIDWSFGAAWRVVGYEYISLKGVKPKRILR